MKIQPTKKRLIAKRCESESVTTGGIVLPESVQAKSQFAKIIAVGSDFDFKEGDTVVLGHYAGSEFRLNGAEYLSLTEDDILCVVG